MTCCSSHPTRARRGCAGSPGARSVTRSSWWAPRPPPSAWPGRAGRRASAAAEHGLPYAKIEPVESGRAAADVAVERVLAGLGEGRTGVVVPNGAVLQPSLHALGRRGVVPGRDISVVALGADATAEETEP